jgi:hypothetical protein
VSAEVFAALVQARRAGAGRWLARCPAHDDRNPSLSIGTGQDGRVLLRCFAGCATSNILAAVGLRFSDLFPDRAPASHVQLQQAALARRGQELEVRARRRADGEACSTVRKLQAVADALGARLARTTDGAAGDALARLYHSTLNRLREAEIKLEGRQ